jgi:hypothetical protein
MPEKSRIQLKGSSSSQHLALGAGGFRDFAGRIGGFLSLERLLHGGMSIRVGCFDTPALRQAQDWLLSMKVSLSA